MMSRKERIPEWESGSALDSLGDCGYDRRPQFLCLQVLHWADGCEVPFTARGFCMVTKMLEYLRGPLGNR